MIRNQVNTLFRWLNSLGRPTKQHNLMLLQQRGEDPGSCTIRPASPGDIPQLAELHVKAWNETYPAARKVSLQTREWQWNEQFKQDQSDWFCLLIQNNKKVLIGFAMGKRYCHEDLPQFSGELNKIYLLKDYQRIGLGKQLVQAAANCFSEMGIHNMVLFGDATNPSCGFHERMGGTRLLTAKGEFHGGYGWNDLKKQIH